MKNLKKQLVSIVTGIILALTISACSKDIGNPEPISNQPPLASCDTTLQITHNNYVSDVLNANCNTNNCHHAGSSNGDFTTYDGIKPYIDAEIFQQRVFVDKDMPPQNSLDSCTILKLKKWINAGAPKQ